MGRGGEPAPTLPPQPPPSLSRRRSGTPYPLPRNPPGRVGARREPPHPGGGGGGGGRGGGGRPPGSRTSAAPHLPQRPRHGCAAPGAPLRHPPPDAGQHGACASTAPGACDRRLEDMAKDAGLRMRPSGTGYRSGERRARQAGSEKNCACAKARGITPAHAPSEGGGERARALRAGRMRAAAAGGGPCRLRSGRPCPGRCSPPFRAQAGAREAGSGPARLGGVSPSEESPSVWRGGRCGGQAARPLLWSRREGRRGCRLCGARLPTLAGAGLASPARLVPVWGERLVGLVSQIPGPETNTGRPTCSVCSGVASDPKAAQVLEPSAFRWAGCAIEVHCGP